LVNPMEEQFLNLGLAYIISSIEKEHRVRLLDMVFHARRYERYVLRILAEDKPDVIGFSVTSFSFPYALKIASLIKHHYPDIPLVYGGVHPTLLPEETIRSPLVDVICIGEGEDAFREYLERLGKNQSPEGVAGIWYKDEYGDVIRNPLRPFREDLDALPFPNWDYWDMDKYLKFNESFIGALRIFSSRGCPYSCTFCSNPAIREAIPGKFYRLRKPEKIIEEIKMDVSKYYNMGFKHLTFADEIFGLDLEHLQKLCTLYRKEGLTQRLTWGCQTRADVITEEWAQMVRQAGCAIVNLGIESGDQYIRMAVYNKKITDEQIMETVRILRENSILYRINIIIGCPGDTRQTIENSFRLVKKLKPVFITSSLYQPLEKTVLGEALLTSSHKRELYKRMLREGVNFKIGLPVSHAKFLRVPGLNQVLLKMRIEKVWSFLILGIELKGMIFVFDVLEYIMSLIRDNRPLFRICSFNELEFHTTSRYIYDKYIYPHNR